MYTTSYRWAPPMYSLHLIQLTTVTTVPTGCIQEYVYRVFIRSFEFSVQYTITEYSTAEKKMPSNFVLKRRGLNTVPWYFNIERVRSRIRRIHREKHQWGKRVSYIPDQLDDAVRICEGCARRGSSRNAPIRFQATFTSEDVRSEGGPKWMIDRNLRSNDWSSSDLYRIHTM